MLRVSSSNHLIYKTQENNTSAAKETSCENERVTEIDKNEIATAANTDAIVIPTEIVSQDDIEAMKLENFFQTKMGISEGPDDSFKNPMSNPDFSSYNNGKKSPEIFDGYSDRINLLEQTIKDPSCTEKNKLKAKFELAKLKSMQADEDDESLNDAVNLYTEIINHKDASSKQIIEAKYRLAWTFKNCRYPKSASEYFGEVLNCEFSNQNTAKINYVELFIEINKDDKNVNITFVLELMNGLINHYQEKIQTISETEKNNLFTAYGYIIKLHLMKNSGYIDKASFKEIMIPFYKIRILGHKMDLNFSELAFRNDKLIRVYLKAYNDLKIINPKIQWFAEFGNLSEFLNMFAALYKQANTQQLEPSQKKQLKIMGKILIKYIKNGMELIKQHINDEETYDLIRQFCNDKTKKMAKNIMCLEEFQNRIPISDKEDLQTSQKKRKVSHK